MRSVSLSTFGVFFNLKAVAGHGVQCLSEGSSLTPGSGAKIAGDLQVLLNDTISSLCNLPGGYRTDYKGCGSFLLYRTGDFVFEVPHSNIIQPSSKDCDNFTTTIITHCIEFGESSVTRRTGWRM